jgi:regulator of protease activity HflC (stomatin/prohibitin superfamily)
MTEPQIFAAVIVFAAIVIIAKSIVIVPQGWQYNVERFGQFVQSLDAGLHFITPVICRVAHKVNVMEQVLDVPSQEIITKDNATVTVDGVIFFQVQDAASAVYEVRHLDVAVMNLTMTNLRTVLGSMDLDEMLSQRDNINSKLLTVVDEATNPWGVKVTRIEIKDISPPRDLVDSMARQMKAERERRASILEAEGLRQAEILKAEGEKKAVELRAEANKTAAFLEADARERLAQADAKATEMLSVAISAGNAQAINYFVAEKYVEALKELASAKNQKVLMLPLDATQLLGSIAGIAEISKEAFGSKK